MSEAEQIPVPVQELVLERIHSIEELEAILMLFADADRLWTARDIRDALRISEGAAMTALETLTQNRLAELVQGRYRYARTFDGPVTQLARAYAEQRVDILVMISHNAINRVRYDALRTFSEAFRLGGPKKDG